jgi:hypothetical protein
LAPHARSTVLGLPNAATACALTFAEGGLADYAVTPNLAFSFFNLKPVLPVTKALNPQGTSLSLSNANGLFSGKFTVMDGRIARPVTYSGAIIRSSDDSLKAQGFFLLPRPLAPGQRSSPHLSGLVEITQQ